MGRFASYFYSDGAWVERDPHSGIVTPTPPWLHFSIHDSDFAAIRYEPSAPGTGTAFVGITPRDYFEDPDASAPTDTKKEARGLVAWAREVQHGLIPDMQAVRLLLADDGADEPDRDDPGLTDDEIFVEGKCRRVAGLLGLPNPPGL